MNDPRDPFSDAQAVVRYAEDPPRKVPGFADLQRMVALLLAERAPEDARILVLGAGGGLELKRSQWLIRGGDLMEWDPSSEMLKLAERTLGPLSTRVNLQRGYIHEASEGSFDGGTCLLTLHFLATYERRHTLGQMHRPQIRCLSWDLKP